MADLENIDDGVLSRATQAAQDALTAVVEEAGGRVLATVLLVHVDGVTPNGNVRAWTDDELGPQNPPDILAFALSGIGQLARRYGLDQADRPNPPVSLVIPEGHRKGQG